MTFITSNMPDVGYPPNCVGAAQMTKRIANDHYDTQRPEIDAAMFRRQNPPKPSYTLPIIGLAVSALATVIVSRIRRRP